MDLKNIKELYQFLEKADIDSRGMWDTTKIIKKLEVETTDEKEKAKLKFECWFIDFMLVDGKVKPLHSTTKQDGTTIFAYPSFTDFTVETLEYLKLRIAMTKNVRLKARYAHILASSGKGKLDYAAAKMAIDSYLKIARKESRFRDKEKGFEDKAMLKNGFAISLSINYKVKEFKNLIRKLLFGKQMLNEYKVYLLRDLAENKLFKRDDFKGTEDLMHKIYLGTTNSHKNIHFKQTVGEIGLTLAQKCGWNVKIWKGRIGDMLVKSAESRMDDDSKMVPMHFYQQAIPYYKEAGLIKKVKLCEKRYCELKPHLKLGKVPFLYKDEVLDAFYEIRKKRTELLMKEEPDMILHYLRLGKDIFPDIDMLKQSMKDHGDAFMETVTLLRFDRNKNMSKAKADPKIRIKEKIYESYEQHLYAYGLPHLQMIFVEGISRQKITIDTFLDFIMEHTWYGQDLTDTDSSNEPYKYRWTSLIGPAILEYFIQMESALKSGSPYINIVMPVDSLTLKFEGALRDFARQIGVNTTVSYKKEELREMYIEDLLRESKIKEAFNENDLLLFNYLFVAKTGMNLRNNIAHCFYGVYDYNIHKFHLLICAFLRLGKHKFKKR